MANNAGKLKFTFDPADAANSDTIGSYTLDGSGNAITSTTGWLDVAVQSSVLPTGAATETTLASVLTELQNITHAEDSAHTSGDAGVMALAVRSDAGGSLVSADGDYSPLSINSTGELRVAASVTLGAQYAEDSAHSSGATGLFTLGVRNDDQATTMTSANGDYAAYTVDDRGALFTKQVYARTNLQQVITVGTTAVALPATPLANRSSMFVQMLSGGALYLGSSSVTNSGATRGLQLGNGGYASLDVGPGNLVYGVANAANKDVMVWEFA